MNTFFSSLSKPFAGALVLVMLGFYTLQAQTVVTLAAKKYTNSVGSSYYVYTNEPFDIYDANYVGADDIYQSSEITAAGGANGTITTLEWTLETGPSSVTIPVKIYMALVPTTTTTIASATYSSVTGAATLVYSGSATFNAAGYANPITLTTPFAWNTTKNLEIITESDLGSTVSSSNAPFWGTRANVANSDGYWLGSSQAHLNSAGLGGTDYNRPAVKLTIVTCTAPTISVQSTATQTQCMGGAFSAISVTPAGTSPYTYQWYSDATGLNSGGTSVGSGSGGQTASYTPPATTAGTEYYYCVVTGQCTPTVSSAVSGAFITQSTTNNPGTITLSSTSECTGGAAITVANTVSATTGTPASTGPNYDFYYSTDNEVTWHSFQNTTTATATVPTALLNTPGTVWIARNSYFTCPGTETNSGNTVLSFTITGPNVQNTAPTGVGTGGATLNGTY